MIETVLYKTDRPEPYSWFWTKLNPIWWFGNDEAKPGDGFYYLYIRNPINNFRRFVIGVGDRDHWVTGPAPALTNVPSDLGVSGFHWSVIWIGPVPVLPGVSWSVLGKWDFYFGWLPWGEFGLRSTGPWAFYLDIGLAAAVAGVSWYWYVHA